MIDFYICESSGGRGITGSLGERLKISSSKFDRGLTVLTLLSYLFPFSLITWVFKRTNPPNTIVRVSPIHCKTPVCTPQVRTYRSRSRWVDPRHDTLNSCRVPVTTLKLLISLENGSFLLRSFSISKVKRPKPVVTVRHHRRGLGTVLGVGLGGGGRDPTPGTTSTSPSRVTHSARSDTRTTDGSRSLSGGGSTGSCGR